MGVLTFCRLSSDSYLTLAELLPLGVLEAMPRISLAIWPVHKCDRVRGHFDRVLRDAPREIGCPSRLDGLSVDEHAPGSISRALHRLTR